MVAKIRFCGVPINEKLTVTGVTKSPTVSGYDFSRKPLVARDVAQRREQWGNLLEVNS